MSTSIVTSFSDKQVGSEHKLVEYDAVHFCRYDRRVQAPRLEFYPRSNVQKNVAIVQSSRIAITQKQVRLIRESNILLEIDTKRYILGRCTEPCTSQLVETWQTSVSFWNLMRQT